MPTRSSKKKSRTGFVRWITYWLGRVVITGFHYLPLPIAYYSGRGIGWCAWKLMPKRRSAVARNLEVVNAHLAAEGPNLALDEQIREVFLRSGANMLSSFCFARMSPAKIEQHIVCEGVEHFDAALADEKGVLVLLAHMGPWEVLAFLPMLLAKQGYRVNLAAMYRPMNNVYFDRWFKSVREQRGTKLFSKDDGFHKPVDFLRGGGTLGVLADQKMRQGALAPLFGAKVKTSPLPGLFQRRSGAPALAVSVETTAPMKWKITASPVGYPEENSSRTRESDAVITNQAIEWILKQSVSDGFWLTERFS